MRAKPIPLIVRSAVKVAGNPTEREPTALLPAIHALVSATCALDVRIILDGVPEVLWAPIAAYMAQRPEVYPDHVVREVARAAGRDRIRQVIGKRRTSNIMTRYDLRSAVM